VGNEYKKIRIDAQDKSEKKYKLLKMGVQLVEFIGVVI
jgi:hypothetical protein